MAVVQIVYGSKWGGTKGLAEMIGAELTKRGDTVSVADAAQAGLDPDAQAVIVAGALRVGRWHEAATEFVKKHAKALRELPVWLVSSGPLDDSAEKQELPPPPGVAKLAQSIGARGCATFGGVLDESATGFIGKALVKNGKTGDFRSPHHIATWVDAIEKDLPD
ncbi:MAG: flavodoxin domain-containing protein [Bifidobacteriaceae bacterium]|jgi:menaquinone-dependent protoporphyrinogen oxidase|nr:flavodoxin domain-containing protein [Bifidobacteriaceae bacterium]